jgi:DNA polymerase V
MLALCDCNSFYVGAERVFAPQFRNQPVIVLSNNDGCVVARSPEAKAIGIKMGVPVFQIQDLICQHKVQVFSSNYSLYGDMSQRVMSTLAEFTPTLEVYSIDESFLDLSGFGHLDLIEYGHEIRQVVRQWTGIPVSIGISSTKTLSKVANHLAKLSDDGVSLLNPENTEKFLADFPVEEIWGIGRSHTRSLSFHNIATALQLRDASLDWAKQEYGVVMQRTILELRGQRCFELELSPPTKKSITVSRSFSRPIESLPELKEVIATYTSRAAEKLRSHGLTTDAVQVFARTSHHVGKYYGDSVTLTLNHSSDNTAEILQYALRGCDRIFQSGQRFKKAGVLLLGLIPKTQRQLSLWEPDEVRSDILMQTLDSINAKFGRGTLQFAVAGLQKSWAMKGGMLTLGAELSHRYTTCWSELPVAKA